MAKVTVKISNVTWRDGRPRFNPGPKLRKLGYKGEDLRHGEAGPWFTLAEAADWAKARADEIAGRRQAKAETGRLPKRRPARHQTIDGLFDEWFESPKFKGGVQKGKRQQKGASANTIKDYGYKRAALKAHDAELMEAPPAAITPQIAQGIFDSLWETKGLHTARGVVAVASSCWKWAKNRGRGGVTYNPWRGLEKPLPEPRLVTWSDAEVRAFAAAADLLGRPEMGDSLYLGLFTGQRQADRLLLEHTGKDDEGRHVFRQMKTNAIVAVRATAQLVGRLEAAAVRRKDATVTWQQLIIDETAGRPFKSDWYRHVFAEVRLAAVRGLVRGADGKLELGPKDPHGVNDWALRPTPALADRRDQDLRDTAVTWLGRAGCTVPQIASITGHSFVSIHQVLRHYLATHPDMADEAISKLVAWLDKKGMAV